MGISYNHSTTIIHLSIEIRAVNHASCLHVYQPQQGSGDKCLARMLFSRHQKPVRYRLQYVVI